MTERRWIILLGGLVLALALLASVTVWAASAGQQPDARGPSVPVGTDFTYQGRLRDGDEPVNGTCDMAFRLFDGIGPGDRPVGDPISLKVPVSDGLFTVELDFGSTAFRGDARWLDVTVQCPGDKEPTNLGRQELTAVPYALYALEAPWGGLPYAGVVVVAKGGGDYASVQAAIDSITTASAEHPFLVWIAPGVYEEQVTMKPYVHLQGAGQEATIIRSDAGSGAPNVATLKLASSASLRDLTVGNTGAAGFNLGVLATAGTTSTLVADATVKAQGVGSNNYGFFLGGGDTEITLQEVTSLAEGASISNLGLVYLDDAAVRLRGGSFAGRGGGVAAGIEGSGAGTSLEAEGVTALGEDGTDENSGLRNGNGAAARLRSGSFTGRGGMYAAGIRNQGTDPLLEADNVLALGEGGTDSNRGMWNDAGVARLHGGSYIGRGTGTGTAMGIYGYGTELEAVSVHALGEGGSANGTYGLYNAGSATNVIQSVLEGAWRSVAQIDGDITVSNSRLVGGQTSGTVTCVAVSRDGTFNASGCP
jgi:hypothetical protein